MYAIFLPALNPYYLITFRACSQGNDTISAAWGDILNSDYRGIV
jgi:hypothetical protein